MRTAETAVRDDLLKAESEVLAAAVQLRQTRAQIAEVQEQMQQVERQLSETELDKRRHTELFQRRLRGFYIRSRVSALEIVLGSSSVIDFLTRLISLESIMSRDRELIAQIRADSAALAGQHAALEGKRVQLLSLQDRVEADAAQLAQQIETKKALAARIESQGQEYQQQLDDLDKDSGKLTSLIKQLMARPTATPTPRPQPTATPTPKPLPTATPSPAAETGSSSAARPAATPPPEPTPVPDTPGADASLRAPAAATAASKSPAPGKGALSWPLEGIITTEFGEPSPFQRRHSGIDIADPIGSPVVAAADGTVIFAGLFNPDDRRSYGLTVVIAHGARLSSVYAHLDDKRFGLSVRLGQQVRKGQLLGRVGATGWTTGPHLHFETRVDGNPENPRKFL